MDPGDGLDNDCDGNRDEEILDGKDNDGDGKIDEDLEMVNQSDDEFKVRVWLVNHYINLSQ